MPYCGMPLSTQHTHGNLMSYKVYVRPAVHRMYGYNTKTASKHQKNVHMLLQALFAHGTGTTWDLAKVRRLKAAAIREQEKVYRRLLVGRTDRGRYSGGLLDAGLVVRDDDAQEGKNSPYARYRLSMYGILYCVDVLEPTKKETDSMVRQYAFLLPRVFGMWKPLKHVLGREAAYDGLKILSKGLYLNNISMARTDSPLYELMSFIHVKYRHRFESISQHDLSEQVSYWFFTFLLYLDPKSLKAVLAQDEQLHKWYKDFFRQAKSYYAERMRAMRGSGIF